MGGVSSTGAEAVAEPLMLWVLWHSSGSGKEPTEAFQLASELHRLMGSAWALRPEQREEPRQEVGGALAAFHPIRVGIPIRFIHSAGPCPTRVWDTIRAEPADERIVLLLVDGEMRNADRQWRETIEMLRNEGERLLPVALTPRAHDAHLGLHGVSFLSSHGRDESSWGDLYVRILVEVARVLHRGREIGVFLSHARDDGNGAEVAAALERRATPGVRPFLDVRSIGPGRTFKDDIDAALKHETQVFVAILNEPFPRRRWTIYETSEAVRLKRPIVVVDAISGRASRLPLGLAGAPVVRWDPDDAVQAAQSIYAAVLETFIRRVVHPRRVDAARRTLGEQWVDKATAVASLTVKRKSSGVGIYPDPPRPPEELRLIGSDKSLRSFTQYLADCARGKRCLRSALDRPSRGRLQVGLSVSPTRPPSYGIEQPQINDLLLDISSLVLELGGAVVFGHDLRPGGPARQLRQLAADHTPSIVPRAAFTHFVAWPIHLTRTSGDATSSAGDPSSVSHIEDITPEGLPDHLRGGGFIHWRAGTEENHRWWANALTEMRRGMAEATSARVAVGGPMHDYAGRMPGVVEEVWECIGPDSPIQPIYLVGGFGGAARALYDAICGKPVDEFRAEWQRNNSARYEELGDRSVQDSVWRDVRRTLADLGPKGLSDLNGLDEDENRRLAETRNTVEILYLVGKGLCNALGTALD